MITDELIDKNLKLISDHKKGWFAITDLQDEKGNQYYSTHSGFDTRKLAQEMADSNLIDFVGDRCDLTRNGREIISNGGWLNHLKATQKQKNKQNGRENTSHIGSIITIIGGIIAVIFALMAFFK